MVIFTALPLYLLYHLLRSSQNLRAPIIPAPPSAEGNTPQYQWLDVTTIPPSPDAGAVISEESSSFATDETWLSGVKRIIAKAVLPLTGTALVTPPETDITASPFMGPDQMRVIGDPVVVPKPEPVAAPAPRGPKSRKPDSMPPSVSTDVVPNLWMAVGHTSSLKGKKVRN